MARVSADTLTRGQRFARRVFVIAGIYGIAVLLPQYLLETGLGPPGPLVRPEHFYGFIGVALTWQIVFLFIASDVVRYHPLMLVGVLEKLSFGVAAVALYLAHRADTTVLLAGTIDLVLGSFFVAAYLASRASPPPGDPVKGGTPAHG